MTKWFWARYDDVGKVIELSAVYDDALKKNMSFVNYACLLANRICEELELPCQATYGKWGARLEPSNHPNIPQSELEGYADKIINNFCWKALQESTHVFTYGNVIEKGPK